MGDVEEWCNFIVVWCIDLFVVFGQWDVVEEVEICWFVYVFY